LPNPKSLPHTFFEFATDVVIVGDVAWVIGASHGKHELFTEEIRGLLVPMDLHTGEVLSPVVIAPKMDVHTQSAFWGATYHPAGVVVTGYACDATCTNYRIVTSLYDAAGALLWYQSDAAGPGIRYGRDVALDSQGRAIIGGSVPDFGAQRGFVFAHTVKINEALPLFEHWFPASSKPSEVLGVLVNDFDRLFAAGFITANGETHSQITLISG